MGIGVMNPKDCLHDLTGKTAVLGAYDIQWNEEKGFIKGCHGPWGRLVAWLLGKFWRGWSHRAPFNATLMEVRKLLSERYAEKLTNLRSYPEVTFIDSGDLSRSTASEENVQGKQFWEGVLTDLIEKILTEKWGAFPTRFDRANGTISCRDIAAIQAQVKTRIQQLFVKSGSLEDPIDESAIAQTQSVGEMVSGNGSTYRSQKLTAKDRKKVITPQICVYKKVFRNGSKGFLMKHLGKGQMSDAEKDLMQKCASPYGFPIEHANAPVEFGAIKLCPGVGEESRLCHVYATGLASSQSGLRTERERVFSGYALSEKGKLFSFNHRNLVDLSLDEGWRHVVGVMGSADCVGNCSDYDELIPSLCKPNTTAEEVVNGFRKIIIQRAENERQEKVAFCQKIPKILEKVQSDRPEDRRSATSSVIAQCCEEIAGLKQTDFDVLKQRDEKWDALTVKRLEERLKTYQKEAQMGSDFAVAAVKVYHSDFSCKKRKRSS